MREIISEYIILLDALCQVGDIDTKKKKELLVLAKKEFEQKPTETFNTLRKISQYAYQREMILSFLKKGERIWSITEI